MGMDDKSITSDKQTLPSGVELYNAYMIIFVSFS
jgi:hypothetical protein